MREPTLFARSSWTMIVITSPAYVDDGAPFTALYSRAPIDVVKLFVNGGQHAFLLRRRSELLLFDVAFTGSSECAIHPVAQHASPDALSKAARQHLLPFSFSPTHADVCLCTGDAGRRGRGGALLLLGAGGRSRTPSASPGCAGHWPPPRFWPWRPWWEAAASRRRSGRLPRAAVWGASGVLIQINLYMYVRIVSPCAPPT